MRDDQIQKAAEAALTAIRECASWVENDPMTLSGVGVDGVVDCYAIATAVIRSIRDAETVARKTEGVHWDYYCYVCGGVKEGWEAIIDEMLRQNESAP